MWIPPRISAFSLLPRPSTWLVSGLVDNGQVFCCRLQRMRLVRRRLSAIACVWLVSQLGVVTTVPVLIATGYAEGGKVCTCAALGPGHYCPLHGAGHHEGSSSDVDQGPRDCTLNSPATPSTAPLLSLPHSLAPMPSAPVAPSSSGDPEQVATTSSLPISRPASPELPPPR
jgi:hypothetical protein